MISEWSRQSIMFDSREFLNLIIFKYFKVVKKLIKKNFSKFDTLHNFSRGVGPACLPFLYQGFAIGDNTLLTAVGFGTTEFVLNSKGDTKSWILQKVSLYVNQTLASDCKINGTLCAIGALSGYTRGDTCTRDSGGLKI